MGLEVCPCGKCTTETGRSLTCHSNCERYSNWKQKLDNLNDIRRKQLDKESLFWNNNSSKRKHR